MSASKNSANALHDTSNQHIVAKVFSSSQISIEDIYLSFYLFIVSADRALFCFDFHRIFQILTRRKQKAKISFRISAKFRKAFHIDHAFFCSVFHRVFQILMRHRQRTKNHLFYSSINRACCHCFDYHSIIDRHRRKMNQSRFESDLQYIKHVQIFRFFFFIFSS